jgi:hypothetical protein
MVVCVGDLGTALLDCDLSLISSSHLRMQYAVNFFGSKTVEI